MCFESPLSDSKAVEVYYNSCLENLLKFYWGFNPETLQACVCNFCIVGMISKEAADVLCPRKHSNYVLVQEMHQYHKKNAQRQC